MSNRRRKLLASMVFSAIAVFAALAGEQSRPFLVPFGVLQVVFLPGYVISCCLLPRLARMERALVSIGLSLALTILGGICLNMTPFGLGAVSWALYLGAVTISASIWAFRSAAGDEGQGHLGWRRPSPFAASVLASALVILCGAVGTAALSARIDDTPFTQLWALPSRDRQATFLDVGVRNMEGTGASYRVTVEDTMGPIADWGQISIESGDEWRGRLGLEAVPEEPLRVLLYKDGKEDSAYRWLDVWPTSFKDQQDVSP